MGKLDLPSDPLFGADRIQQTRQQIQASNLKIACVSSSAQMYVEDAAKRAKELSDAKHVGLLWDAHHTYATANEDPEFTVKQLGPWIRHTHLKDSVGSGDDRHYVLTGRGNVPIQRQVDALRSIGYKGFYCFEWEKLWHPEIDDPEITIADYAHVVGDCLGNAKSCGP